MNPVRSQGLESIQLPQLVLTMEETNQTPDLHPQGFGRRVRETSGEGDAHPKDQEETQRKVRRPYRPRGQGVEGKNF